MARDDDGNPDDVGYKRPPKAKQFKPGESGNPKGRTKGRSNIRTALERAYAGPIKVRDGNRTRNITRIEAIVRKQIEAALKGNLRAIEAVLKSANELGLLRPPLLGGLDLSSLTNDELETFLRLVKKTTGTG
jgi:hypothetical protein